MCMKSIPELREHVNLSSYGKREKAWDIHKATSDTVSAIYAKYSNCPRDERKADRIRDCAGYLDFGWYHNGDTGNNEIHLLRAHFCHCRACIVCACRRSLMLKARFSMNIEKVLDEYPTARFIFLTLTVKNCDVSDLKATLKNMSLAFKNLMRDKTTSKDILGYIRNFEVTRGEDDSAHPHYHVLLMVKSSYFKSGHYISQNDYTLAWKKALKVDYTPIVDIRAIRNKSDRIGVVKELFKYTIKELDITLDLWYKNIMEQLHKTRAISSSGALKDVVKDISQESDDDMIHVGKDSATMEALNKVVTYQWNRPIKRYRLKKD